MRTIYWTIPATWHLSAWGPMPQVHSVACPPVRPTSYDLELSEVTFLTERHVSPSGRPTIFSSSIASSNQPALLTLNDGRGVIYADDSSSALAETRTPLWHEACSLPRTGGVSPAGAASMCRSAIRNGRLPDAVRFVVGARIFTNTLGRPPLAPRHDWLTAHLEPRSR